MGLLDRYGEGNAKDSKKKDKKAKKHKRKKEGKEKKQKHKKDTKDRKRKKEKARRSSSSSSSSSSSCDTPTQTHAKTDIGPSLPPATATIGPAMPPGITGDIGPAGPPPGWKPATVGSGSGSDDDIGIGPAGPPPGWAGRVDKGGEHDSDDERKEAGLPSLPVNSAQDDQGEDGGGGGGTRGPMMPMLPAGVRREDLEKLKAETNKIDWQRLAVEEEEEEEDLLGPVAPGQVTRGYVKASMAAEQRAHLDMLAKVEADEAAKLPKHEDWMSMVPEVKSLGFNLDDAQKNRTFLRREKADRGDISEWTDTPADKARREREKELGIAGFKRKPEAACVVDTATATKHTVEQYNRTVRGKTLVEIHREEQKKKASTGRKAGEVALGQWDRSEITQTRVKDDKAIERVFQDATGAGGLGGRFGNSSFHGF